MNVVNDNLTTLFPRSAILYFLTIFKESFKYRCEGRHKPIKSYTKNTSNRIDICYSIGKKEQYHFAQRLLFSRGLEDSIIAKISDIASIKSKVKNNYLQRRHCENTVFH